MKKLLGALLVLVYSCTTTNDSNTTTTTLVPLHPTNLIGTVTTATQINLSWTDNSTNEVGFKIERKTGTGVYAVVGITATDITTFSDNGLTPNTTYTYRVYSNNAVGNSLTYSNELTRTTTSAILTPTLTTTAVSLIATTTAVAGGTISSDGGVTITARGVCWSTSRNPTIALSTKTNDGSGIGTFTSNITGLTSGITYYVRAYSTNNVGTAYGNELSFTVAPALSSVTICTQVWAIKNLDVTTYSDGTVIPQVTDPTEWINLTTGAWCYYHNDATNDAVYGKLYNWYAVMGIYDAASLANPALRKKLAPTGWHVPTYTEWGTLILCLDLNANVSSQFNMAGGKMKATGTLFWQSPNTDATNSSGFTGLPGGNRIYNGTFSYFGKSGKWWSSSEYSTASASSRELSYSGGSASTGNYNKIYGLSVRCIKD